MMNLSRLEHFYEIVNYRNAIGVLQASNPRDFDEFLEACLAFRLTTVDIMRSGGNESNIPKKFSHLLRKKGWQETQIAGDLVVTLTSKRILGSGNDTKKLTIEQFLDGHKIDFVKNRIDFDVEWNSKDQTFDRDLYAFAAFFQANIIDAAILVTRSESLNQVFKNLGVMPKYGASTTWMGKLEYRIRANRSAGCPVLGLGITPKLIEDWNE